MRHVFEAERDFVAGVEGVGREKEIPLFVCRLFILSVGICNLSRQILDKRSGRVQKHSLTKFLLYFILSFVPTKPSSLFNFILFVSRFSVVH